ncbi:zinc dependent phospholipase C family protein [Hymenobacter sp. H14-R3]|uniref:zinc dependent phospholipase C family protein n=1 Tax=Hymenobacter sp. H14-R3 TaxID=3046308 RepID=UPI0024B939DD|nr:zinc dependent phospholipase C family protein [Hymenobacter sp. H14-R3]MDJ0367089.1 zinc dependent phospholipase C family protein [Hymenobacter sp. H14-R3]
MKKTLLSLGLLAGLLGPAAPAARAWGVVGHRVITQVAVYELPTAMQAFYFRHLPELARLSTAPDERRGQDPQEGSRHFIRLDHYSEDNPFAKIPRTYDEAVEKFSADTLQKYGTLPWAVLDAKQQLVAAFRARDTVAIILRSAELSHYAADAFVPLHTTVNYDGQLTGQTGLLALWENQLPERFLKDYKLDGEESKVLKDPLAAIWLVLQNSYGFLTSTYDLEAKTSKGLKAQTKYTFSHRFGRTQRRYSDAFADAYEKEVGGMVAFRLKGASPLVASLWLTAWQEAGRPDLAQLLVPPKLSKEEKDHLTTQLKAWKANTLYQDQLLLALQKEKKSVDADEIKAAEGEAAPPPPPELVAPAAPKQKAPLTPAATAPPAKAKAKTKGPEGTNKQKATDFTW